MSTPATGYRATPTSTSTMVRRRCAHGSPDSTRGFPRTSLPSRPEVEVRVEDPHLGDGVDGQSVRGRGALDRLAARTIDHAVRPRTVARDIGGHPGDALFCVVVDHGETRFRPFG